MRLALAALFALLACLAVAQEPTPTPVAAPTSFAPAPAVINLGGAPAAIVPAPPDASPAEVTAVARQSAENLEAVAAGEVSLAAATRDPTSGAPDPGDGSLFWVLALVFGSVVRPVTDAVVGRIKGLDDKLAGAINAAALLVTYIGAWALFHGSNPALPQDVMSWVIAGFAAAGLGSATTSGLRSRQG